jgi:hypothetical protein
MEVNLFTSRRYQEGTEAEIHQDTQHTAVLHPHTISSQVQNFVIKTISAYKYYPVEILNDVSHSSWWFRTC